MPHENLSVCGHHDALMQSLTRIEENQEKLWTKFDEIQRSSYDTSLKQADTNGYLRGTRMAQEGYSKKEIAIMVTLMSGGVSILVMVLNQLFAR